MLNVLIYFLIVQMGRCVLILFFLNLLLREQGGASYCFFSPPFDLWKEEGKGVYFFLKLFFHC